MQKCKKYYQHNIFLSKVL